MHTYSCEMREKTRKKLSELLVSVRVVKLSDLSSGGLTFGRYSVAQLHDVRNFSIHSNDLTVKGQKFIEHLTFETETNILFRNVGADRPVRRRSIPKEREPPKKSFVVLFVLCAFI